MSLHTAALGLGTGGGFSGSSEATSGVTSTNLSRRIFNVFGGSGGGGSATLSDGGNQMWLLLGLGVIAAILFFKK